jgi:hypothetical protein
MVDGGWWNSSGGWNSSGEWRVEGEHIGVAAGVALRIKLHRLRPWNYTVTKKLVVIAAHKEIDPIIPHEIHEPMLLCDSARPNMRAHVAQRLRLSDAAERIAHDGIHEVQDTQRDTAVRLDPEPQIVTEFILESRNALRSALSPSARTQPCFAGRAWSLE